MKAFTNATIHQVIGPILQQATLIIEQDKVKSLGVDLDTSGMEVIDCTGKHIIPGLIDAHTHTGVWEEGSGPGPGNNDGNEYSEAIVPFLRTIDSLHPEDVGFGDARKSGVTTVGITHGSANPIGGQFCVAKTYGIEADQMTIRSPAGLKMALGENPKRVGEMRNRAPVSRMGIAHLIRKAFYDAIDYQTKWQVYDEKVSLEETKPESERKPIDRPKFDLGMDTLLRVLTGQIPVRCHSHRADDIRTAIRLSDEFGYRLIIDHATESYKIKETIAARDIPVVVGPLFGGRAKRELLHQSMATPGIMMKAGCTVCIMTDSPFNPQHGLRDNVIMAVREGLPEDRALETVTINPAKILGVEDRVGSLEPGKDADFVIFNGDPLDARTRVYSTYIDGLQVFKDH